MNFEANMEAVMTVLNFAALFCFSTGIIIYGLIILALNKLTDKPHEGDFNDKVRKVLSR